MWNPIEIEENSFIYKIEIENETLRYFLSDWKEVWCETCSVEKALVRAREMNKRIDYDRETILNAIKSKPELISLDTSGEKEQGHINIKAKYNVHDLPFNFIWKTVRRPPDEFLKLITKPLLLTVASLSQQNQALKDIIRKKDVEVEQYRLEGAVLKRSKVATELFDEAVFGAKYAKVKTDEFIKYAEEKFESLKSDCPEVVVEKPDGSDNGQKFSVNTKSNLTKSPKRSKLSKNERKKKLQQLRLQVGRVRYDDSDSCTPPDGDNDVEGIKHSLQELNRKQQESLKESAQQSTSDVNAKKPKRIKKLNL